MDLSHIVELEQDINNAVTMFLEDNLKRIRLFSLNNVIIAVVCIPAGCYIFKLSNVSVFGLHLHFLDN